MESFSEGEFRRRVQDALGDGRILLENARAQHYLADEGHNWNDGFLLAQSLVNVGIRSFLKTLEKLGLSKDHLIAIFRWQETRTVSLRFKAEETCEFLRKTEREVQSDVRQVTENTLIGTTTSYSVTKVTEYFWTFRIACSIAVMAGTGDADAIVLCSHTTDSTIKTTTQTPPKQHRVCPPIDVDVSWTLAWVNDRFEAAFDIDRTNPTCRTPLRNPDMEAATLDRRKFMFWCASVTSYFQSHKLLESDKGLHDRIAATRQITQNVKEGAGEAV